MMPMEKVIGYVTLKDADVHPAIPIYSDSVSKKLQIMMANTKHEMPQSMPIFLLLNEQISLRRQQ